MKEPHKPALSGYRFHLLHDCSQIYIYIHIFHLVHARYCDALTHTHEVYVIKKNQSNSSGVFYLQGLLLVKIRSLLKL